MSNYDIEVTGVLPFDVIKPLLLQFLKNSYQLSFRFI